MHNYTLTILEWTVHKKIVWPFTHLHIIPNLSDLLLQIMEFWRTLWSKKTLVGLGLIWETLWPRIGRLVKWELLNFKWPNWLHKILSPAGSNWLPSGLMSMCNSYLFIFITSVYSLTDHFLNEKCWVLLFKDLFLRPLMCYAHFFVSIQILSGCTSPCLWLWNNKQDGYLNKTNI